MTAACSLLVSVPTDEYTSGAANNDAAAPETSAGGEGGASTIDDGGSVATGACDATFCETFDEGPLGANWAQMEAFGGGELALVPSTQGPPNALRVRLNAPAVEGAARSAFLAKTFPVPKQARCSVDVFAGPGLGAGDDIEVLSLQATSGGKLYSLHVKVGNDELHFREGISGESTSSAEIQAEPWTGAWMHLEIDVELGVRAMLTGLGQKQELALRAFPADNVSLVVGESSDSDSWAYEVLVDNVVCTLTP